MTSDDCCCPTGRRCIRCVEDKKLGTFATRSVCVAHRTKAPNYLIRRHRDGKGRLLEGWSVYEFVPGRWDAYRRILQRSTFEEALGEVRIKNRVAYMKTKPYLVA